MTRPSPSSSANSTGVGKKRRGNDGLMYTVAETRAGQRRWVLTDATQAPLNPPEGEGEGDLPP
jgi:hypothetical protein